MANQRRHSVSPCLVAAASLFIVACAGAALPVAVDIEPGAEASTGYISSYLMDDGFAESAIGTQNGGHLIWLNQFSVIADRETISSVEVAYGPCHPGLYVRAFIWSDPNQDGNPSDAEVITYGTGFTENTGTNIFNIIDVPDKFIGPAGTSFFVGLQIYTETFQGPARLDQSRSAGRSWFIAGGTQALDPDNLWQAQTIGIIDSFHPSLAGNWMIRAGAVPNGSAAVLLLLPLARRRCR